jgi:hypothetical protein
MRGATQRRTRANSIGPVNGLGRSHYTFNHLFEADTSEHSTQPKHPCPMASYRTVCAWRMLTRHHDLHLPLELTPGACSRQDHSRSRQPGQPCAERPCWPLPSLTLHPLE